MHVFGQKVKRWLHVAGDLQARIILSILYGLLVLPTGLIAKIGGGLWESPRGEEASFWQERPSQEHSLRSERGQG